jgi:biopolymer transport protein TolQ
MTEWLMSGTHMITTLASLPVSLASIAPVGAVPKEEFSYMGLFIAADPVVKAVMLILLLASIWSWAIIIDKQFLFGKLRSQARRFEEVFWAGRSLDDLSASLADKPKDPMGRVFAAAMRELRESKGAAKSDGQLIAMNERIDRVMGLVVQREIAEAERGLGILASIASASPFIGLLGTVWGIMNSFRAIAVSQNTNLAVVAPGIAEALFATALGLFAAIPAVIFYNKFAADSGRIASQLEGFSDELSAILSRRIAEQA